ncbi:hypothetical protein [Sulfurisphaera ohwakuensis]|uniref:type III-G CRISPR-associated protein Csx26 n=1 Tax=Sulfurisphaera ohwakuensis TaxID=69656 RepID=UPI0036F1F639
MSESNVIIRKLVDCEPISLNLSFKEKGQLIHFLFLIKTLLRCKFERKYRERYFGTAKKGRAFMSKVLYIPEIENNTLKSLEICIVAEDNKNNKVLENLKKEDLRREIIELYSVFILKEYEYYNRDKRNIDLGELSKFFKKCLGKEK